MSRTRRSFTTEYKVEASHRVIDSCSTIAEVNRELGLAETLLGKWVAEERRRIPTAEATESPPTTAECTELIRLREQVSEQENHQFPEKSIGVLGGPATKVTRLKVHGS